MPTPDTSHTDTVNAWMERVAEGLASEQLTEIFDRAFAALWRRAHQTLGDVTLTAIVDRVLCDAVEKYPMFSALKLKTTGLSCEVFRRKARSLPGDQLKDGIRFVLVEFLTVLGNLTADIVTPSLHEELDKLVSEQKRPGVKVSAADPRKGSAQRRGRKT